MNLINGTMIFNATPHPINFLVDGGLVVVDVDTVINATATEKFVSNYRGVILVKTVFVGNPIGVRVINAAIDAGATIIVGSIIAAQAYPGQIVAMVPVQGYERVSPDEKRMRDAHCASSDKFTTFG